MNPTLCNKMNLLSCGSSLENGKGQHKPPGMLTLGNQFRKATKPEHRIITVHLKVNLEVKQYTVRKFVRVHNPPKIHIYDTLRTV